MTPSPQLELTLPARRDRRHARMDGVVIPPFSDYGTSRDAAVAMEEHASAVRDTVYHAVASSPSGLTCEEVCRLLQLDGNTVRPRLWELTGQARGFPARIIKTTERRQNISGRSAVVYRRV